MGSMILKSCSNCSSNSATLAVEEVEERTNDSATTRRRDSWEEKEVGRPIKSNKIGSLGSRHPVPLPQPSACVGSLMVYLEKGQVCLSTVSFLRVSINY